MTDQKKKATKVDFERKKPALTVQDLLRSARGLEDQGGPPEAEPPSARTSEPERP